jgi:hypothetical protein
MKNAHFFGGKARCSWCFFFIHFLLFLINIKTLRASSGRDKTRKHHHKAENDFALSKMIGNFNVQNNSQVGQLIQEAEEAAKNLEEKIDAKIASLQQEAEIESQKFYSNAKKQARQLFEQAAEQASEVTQRAANEARELKIDAVDQVVDIINEADEKALDLRKKERELVFQQRKQRSSSTSKEKRERISSKWKNKMAAEFNENSSFMKKIIIEGEDTAQLSDFLQLFNNQRIWFDQTLRGTRYEKDQHYNQIIKKQMSLRNIINAQKQADSILAEIAQKIKFNNKEQKKIRLLVLYEINAFFQKNIFIEKQPITQQSLNTLNDQGIRYLVLKVANETVGTVKKWYPEFKELDNQALINLALDTKSSDQRDTKKQDNEIKKYFKQENESQAKELIESQLNTKQLQQKLDRLNKEFLQKKPLSLPSSEKNIIKDAYLGGKLEEQEKNNLDLMLKLTNADQKIALFGQQLKDVNEKCNRMDIAELLSQKEIRFAKKRITELQQEIEKQREIESILRKREKLIEEVADRRIDEHILAKQQLSEPK